MDIKPIKSEADYQASLQAIDELWDAEPGSAESDQLEVLAILVEAYENEHFPIDAPSPIEAIEFRMEQEGLTRKALEPFIGSRARVAEVLNGRRGLSLDMIRRLHGKLNIPLESLVLVGTSSGRNIRDGRIGGTVKAKLRTIKKPRSAGNSPVARVAKKRATTRGTHQMANQKGGRHK